MSQELTERVISVIAATQHIAKEKVTPDSTFEELGIDSLDGINILFALENEFNIDIPDDAAQTIRGVREMVEGIARLLEARAEGPTGAPVQQ
jgi:acyl carrier protein